MRYNHRVDANQGEIVAALRHAGWGVRVCSNFGHGIPDLAAHKNGFRLWVECKMPNEKLTPDEAQAVNEWLPGGHIIAISGEAAVRLAQMALSHYESEAERCAWSDERAELQVIGRGG